MQVLLCGRRQGCFVVINSRGRAGTHFKFIFYVTFKERHRVDFLFTFEDLLSKIYFCIYLSFFDMLNKLVCVYVIVLQTLQS